MAGSPVSQEGGVVRIMGWWCLQVGGFLKFGDKGLDGELTVRLK
jgi:hypothetical protein